VDRGKGFLEYLRELRHTCRICDGRIEARFPLLPPVLRSFGTASKRDGLLMPMTKQAPCQFENERPSGCSKQIAARFDAGVGYRL
jgi:hypothetical protein